MSQCKVCTREVTEPNDFCIIHAVDGSFVERVRAAMYIVNEEKAAEKKTEGKRKR